MHFVELLTIITPSIFFLLILMCKIQPKADFKKYVYLGLNPLIGLVRSKMHVHGLSMFTVIKPQYIFFASAAIQGKFRLKRNKPKQEQEVASSQSKLKSDETYQSDLGKQNDQEELPDLDDPDVQKATKKIQVQETVGQGHLLAI